MSPRVLAQNVHGLCTRFKSLLGLVLANLQSPKAASLRNI
jgi:hypothetical protein